VLELPSLSWREVQSTRSIDIWKVIHLAPVIGSRLLRGCLLDHGFHDGLRPDTGDARSIKIITLALNMHSEFYQPAGLGNLIRSLICVNTFSRL
jgi:hypothetical protein